MTETGLAVSLARFLDWVGAKQGTLWFAKAASTGLNLDDPTDAEMWKFLCFLFNRVWLHTVPRLVGGLTPDWVFVAENVRKGWTAYGVWEKKTGRKTAHLGVLVRACVALVDVAARARDEHARMVARQGEERPGPDGR